MDRRLSFQVCNVAALAREFGLKNDAVHAHRRNHLPAFLPALQAQADALTLSQLQAEAMRLYMITLDALARAEAGTLRKVKCTDADTGEEAEVATNVVSHTSVARMIREARAGLDQLTRLAADRPDEQGRPSSRADIELGAAIRAELARTVARTNERHALSAGNEVQAESILDAEVVDAAAPQPAPPPDRGHRSPAVHQRRRVPASDSPVCRRRVRQ